MDKTRKLAILVVEGSSDKFALSLPIRNYLSKNGINDVFECVVYGSDISIHEYADDKVSFDPSGVELRINDVLDDFINGPFNTNKYTFDDIGVVGCLSDLDACYCPESAVLPKTGCSKIEYDVINKRIYCNDVNFVLNRNNCKKDALQILAGINKVKINNEFYVPFKIFYCNLNLEHVLYNKLINFTQEEKEDRARNWAIDYRKDAEKFYEEICSFPSFSDDYCLSWNETELRKRAFDRLTNIKLLLDWLLEMSKEATE